MLLAALATLFAQDHGSITDKPYSTPEDRKAGMRSYRSACAFCHGLEGGGGSNGPSLTTGRFKHGGSDEDLFRSITKGVPDTPMVAHPLDGKEVWQLIAFIRSINMAKGAAESKGDPLKGEQIFAANGCARCHTAGAMGGFVGPDLNGIGARRTLAQLEQSVLEPNAEVLPDYWTLRARTKSGQTVTGRRMNEDMESFQIREPSGRLRSLWKAELAGYEIVHTSPMPSFQGKLQSGELEDLVAYLASLRAVEVR
jgi:putative heme-binding domain-containing protein